MRRSERMVPNFRIAIGLETNKEYDEKRIGLNGLGRRNPSSYREVINKASAKPAQV